MPLKASNALKMRACRAVTGWEFCCIMAARLYNPINALKFSERP
jgi:hypothetical protein